MKEVQKHNVSSGTEKVNSIPVLCASQYLCLRDCTCLLTILICFPLTITPTKYTFPLRFSYIKCELIFTTTPVECWRPAQSCFCFGSLMIHFIKDKIFILSEIE